MSDLRDMSEAIKLEILTADTWIIVTAPVNVFRDGLEIGLPFKPGQPWPSVVVTVPSSSPIMGSITAGLVDKIGE